MRSRGITFRLKPVTRENFVTGELVVAFPVTPRYITKRKVFLETYKSKENVAISTNGNGISGQNTQSNTQSNPRSWYESKPAQYSYSSGKHESGKLRYYPNTNNLGTNKIQQWWESSQYPKFKEIDLIKRQFFATEEELQNLTTFALIDIDASYYIYNLKLDVLNQIPSSFLLLEDVTIIQRTMAVIGPEVIREKFSDIEYRMKYDSYTKVLKNRPGLFESSQIRFLLCYVENL